MKLEQKNMHLITEQSPLYLQWCEELKEEPQEICDFFKSDDAETFVRGWLGLLENKSSYLLRLFFSQKKILVQAIRYGYEKAFSALLKEAYARLSYEEDLDVLSKELRLLKRKSALLIALADISKQWDLGLVTRCLSLLAETCLRLAMRAVLRVQLKKGTLVDLSEDEIEKNCGLFVIAMGKLGAKELNYSSDIDLIVLYDEDKLPYVGKKDKGAFAVRLTKEIISLMDDKTAFGYVFRTDMRLRPDPGSTPVALSTSAALFYYESFAQNWERAAFIKARIVAGDKQAGKTFLKEIRPFIWRRSTDFYALKQISLIKKSLGARSAELQDKSGFNVKLGKGGIREIEFFTQLQQLLWGGRDVFLRSKNTLIALSHLVKAGWIREEDKDALSKAYTFLRTLEHRLQMQEDQQTQTLPKTTEELENFALFFGFNSYDELLKQLNFHCDNVKKAYDSLFDEAASTSKDTLCFSGADLPEETAEILSGLGFKNTPLIGEVVRGWFSGRYRSLRTEQARQLMDDLLMPIFKALSKNESPDDSFLAFDEFLKGLPLGVQLFSLFQSRPALLDLLAGLLGSAPALSLELTRRPELFDSVLSPSFFSEFPSVEALTQQLKEIQTLSQDTEETLEAIRRFVREKKFGCALLFLEGIIEKEQLGKCLSNLVDAVLNVICPIVLSVFEERYGRFKQSDFSFILMGKAGSQEMSFNSDLDILFVYNVAEGEVSEGGKTSLMPSVYYARLTQRIVNTLTLNTKEGVLWQTDMRLRPSGNAGPVAVSFKAFQEYYASSAWTWEFMALTKARIAWGNSVEIQEEITKQLCQKRLEEKIRSEILEMRQKIFEQNISSVNQIKYRQGGMIDIEFSVQYIQLVFASQYPDLLQKSVQAVLEKALHHKLITQDAFRALSEAYLLWSILTACLSLCLNSNEADLNKIPPSVLKVLLKFSSVSTQKELENLIEEKASQALLYRQF